MTEEFSQCYDDVDICLWTDGSRLNQHDAQTACQQRNNSFLPLITNSYTQSKLRDFRFAAWNFLGDESFWIGVRATGINLFHWIDRSSFAGLTSLFSVLY